MHHTDTGNYRTVAEAEQAYRWDYEETISEGRIIIGKLAVKPSEKLLADFEGRYIIEVRQ